MRFFRVYHSLKSCSWPHRDLYYLVKFLPTYALPAGRPGPIRLDDGIFLETDEDPPAPSVVHQEPMRMPASPIRSPTIRINIPDEEMHPPRRMTTNQQLPSPVTASSSRPLRRQATVHSRTSLSSVITFQERDRLVLSQRSEMHLMPGHMPPKSYGLWDALPFSFLFRYLLARWRKERQKDAIKARIRNKSAVSYNLPLEISLYLVCFQNCDCKRYLPHLIGIVCGFFAEKEDHRAPHYE